MFVIHSIFFCSRSHPPALFLSSLSLSSHSLSSHLALIKTCIHSHFRIQNKNIRIQTVRNERLKIVSSIQWHTHTQTQVAMECNFKGGHRDKIAAITTAKTTKKKDCKRRDGDSEVRAKDKLTV